MRKCICPQSICWLSEDKEKYDEAYEYLRRHQETGDSVAWIKYQLLDFRRLRAKLQTLERMCFDSLADLDSKTYCNKGHVFENEDERSLRDKEIIEQLVDTAPKSE